MKTKNQIQGNKKLKVIYYHDELNDEFSGSKIDARKIDKNYKYEHKNFFWNLWTWCIQNVLSGLSENARGYHFRRVVQ